MGQLVSLLCLLASANLDTLLLGINWTLSDRRLSPRAVAVIGLVTSAVTALALAAGNCVTHWVSPWLMQRGPGLLLMGMGAWSVLDWLRGSGEALSAGQEEPPTTWRQTLTLALVLGVNNCGIGVGAGLAGYGPWLAGGLNLLLTWGMLLLGQRCAGWVQRAGAERWAALGSGLLLIMAGAATAGGR